MSGMIVSEVTIEEKIRRYRILVEQRKLREENLKRLEEKRLEDLERHRINREKLIEHQRALGRERQRRYAARLKEKSSKGIEKENHVIENADISQEYVSRIEHQRALSRERKRRYRAKLKEKNCKRLDESKLQEQRQLPEKADMSKEETEEARKERLKALSRERARRYRANLRAKKLEEIKLQNQKYYRNKLETMTTPEQIEERRRVHREAVRRQRANETPEQTELRRKRDRERARRKKIQMKKIEDVENEEVNEC